MYHLEPHVILQNTLSAELDFMILNLNQDKIELDNIYKEFNEIFEIANNANNDYNFIKLQELNDLFLLKRLEYTKRFEILKVIIQNAIFLN